MSVELLQTLSVIAYLLAAVLFALAVFLFFYLKVPALWGEVSGRTARKAIAAMKWKGEDATLPAKRTDAAVPSEKGPLIAPPTEDGQTAVLPAEVGQTAVLHNTTGREAALRADETSLLTQETTQSAAPSVFFEMEKELAFTDSTEIIE